MPMNFTLKSSYIKFMLYKYFTTIQKYTFFLKARCTMHGDEDSLRENNCWFALNLIAGTWYDQFV